MAEPRDYYTVLGVDRNATTDEIRKAFRTLARQYHPDVNKSEDAAARFNEIQEAYDVLCDDEKRRNYDRFGHAGVGAEAGRRSGPASWTWSSGGSFDPEDFGSVFEQMFSGAAGSPFGASGSSFGATRTRARARTGPRARAAPVSGRDVQQTLTIPFHTAALGGRHSVQVRSGGATAQTIELKIPAGIRSGAKLRVPGRGLPGAAGGRPGDLLFTIEVAAHPYFRRQDNDLLIEVPLTIAEAALGATIDVPLLQGSVQMTVPPGTSSGQKLRVKGQGIADASGTRGDFYAVMKIVAPEQLSDEAREALQRLASELKNPRKSAPWADQSRDGGA